VCVGGGGGLCVGVCALGEVGIEHQRGKSTYFNPKLDG
jgi:hypothetical protein